MEDFELCALKLYMNNTYSNNVSTNSPVPLSYYTTL